MLTTALFVCRTRKFLLELRYRTVLPGTKVRYFLPAALAVLGCGNSVFADAVSWTPNADGSWETATNWSSDPLLPGSSDDVTIDVGGADVRTITINGSPQSVQSIISQELIQLLGGSLTVGVGGGQLHQGFDLKNAARLVANAGSLTVNTASIMLGGRLTASGGGSLSFPDSTSLAAVSTVNSELNATDTRAVVVMIAQFVVMSIFWRHTFARASSPR